MKNFFSIFKRKNRKSYNIDNKNDVIFNKVSYTPEVKNFTIPYQTPPIPASDEQFLKSINEFICLQYSYRNTYYLSKSSMRELICSEKPELKEKFLRFLEKHPLKILLDGDKYSMADDCDTWEIRFIFDDTNFNRSICGYGRTELTAPYLREILADTCEILCSSETFEHQMQMAVFNSQISNIKHETTHKNEQENK